MTSGVNSVLELAISICLGNRVVIIYCFNQPLTSKEKKMART